MRRYGTRVVHAALVALLVSAAGVAALVAIGPRTGAYRTLTVLSGSMRPSFDPGSVVVVRPTPLAQLAVGDVITYTIPVEDRRVVSHRIVELDRSAGAAIVRTKGDANVAVDPWTTRLEGEDAWRVTGAIPFLGYGIAALRTPQLSLLLMLTGPIGLGISFLRDIWRREDDAADLPIDAEGSGPSSPVGALAARRRPLVDGLVLTAAGVTRAARWTDDVTSGRRWLRSAARHA